MLINKVSSATNDDKTKAKMFAALGIEKGYQRLTWPLPNMKPSTEKDFWGWRSSYTFSMEIWVGQIRIGEEWANVMLYWLGHSQFIDGGFAVAAFRQYQKERVEYFEWRACDHKFTHKTIGNCQHLYTCEHCKKSYEVDSSG
jgi:hypothetical protein